MKMEQYSVTMIALAFYELARYEVLYRCGGLRFVLRTMGQPRESGSDCSAGTDIHRALETAICFYPKKIQCLQHSVVKTRLMRRYGLRAEAVIGYCRRPLQCHAWVEVAGKSSNPLEGYQSMMVVLHRV